MDYKKFAAGLRSAAGSYALFYGAPRGDLEKAADVIEELAAKLEPSSTPLTLEELRGMDCLTKDLRALYERATHPVINIKGESYRLKERKEFMRQKQQIVNTLFLQGNN